ncbi:hypothetical protein NE579_16260, partial [Intestinimonas massiliensis]|nr:hypothetical protein [Intestinimonas massiliensis (ex Afouda et al. 2020)]
MEKIPALILSASLIRNPDTRLQALADELYERYGGSWLIPVFMKAIITQSIEQVDFFGSAQQERIGFMHLFLGLGDNCF